MAKPSKPTACIAFKLCPKCFRAVPDCSSERFCINCGYEMLCACPHCNYPILSPEARFCGNCGQNLAEYTQSN